MLTIFRRHSTNCPYRAKGRSHRTCKCPIHVEGSLEGHPIRQGLRTRVWYRAQELVRLWESTGEIRAPIPPVPDCCERFIADCRARGLRESTIAKYQRLCSELVSFCELRNIQSPDQISIEHLSQFRSEWKNRNHAALKKLEALRTLFNFFISREWINTNIAKKLSKPIIRGTPTMPFTREEMAKIVEACDQYDPKHRSNYGDECRDRLKAFVLLLRYTGLRIGDVCTLRKDRLTDGKLLLYTHKTGVPVFVVIPPYVEQELLAIPTSSPDHFFWNGISDPHAPINTWERAIHKLFALAAIKGGHAHRFRDTFAVELLLAGTPIEQVSVLLGHSSIRITEKHYAPWVRARQEQLEADVRRSWRGDPLIKNGLGFDGEGDSSTLVEPECRYRVQ